MIAQVCRRNGFDLIDQAKLVLLDATTFPPDILCGSAMCYAPVSQQLTDSTIVPLTLQACQQVNFGKIALTPAQSEALAGLNRQLVPFCQSLPSALQTGAIFAIQQHFTGFQLGNLQRFFTKFYAPSWTLLGWMGDGAMAAAELEQAIHLQGMAYFLHMLDDHLADGQIPVSHLMLQLRTQAWMRFTQGAEQLVPEEAERESLIYGWINRYFSGVHGPDSVDSLAAYCEQFRQQLSTTLVLPMILADRTGHHAADVQEAYEAFCIAWRLLDDLRDCQDDALAGEMSGVYYLLPLEERQVWLSCRGLEPMSGVWQELARYLELSGVLQAVVGEILGWLAIAQSAAVRANLPGYAEELRQLALPLVGLLAVE
jgi:hypothetical protein